jgi:hypothetical protein
VRTPGEAALRNKAHCVQHGVELYLPRSTPLLHHMIVYDV